MMINKNASSPGAIYGRAVCAFFLFSLACLVYVPALKNGFIWDDVVYVSENTMIRGLNVASLYTMLISFHASNWHPLTWLSLAVDYSFWSLNPLGYHLTNILLHAVNVLLVFAVALRVLTGERSVLLFQAKREPFSFNRSFIAASTAALLFGLHPIHVESVVWVTERKDLLCALFVLLTILSYLNYASSITERKRWRWLRVCLALFLLALMSKPMAVTLPLILLLLDIYPLQRITLYPLRTSQNAYPFLEKIPFLTLSLVSSIVTLAAQHTGGAIRTIERFPPDARMLNALKSLCFYLQKILFPMKLVPYYPFPARVYWFDLEYLIPAIFVFTTTASCLWLLKQGKVVFFIAWSYYVITLLPVLGIIQVGGQSAADRYTYLPSVGIFIIMGVGIAWGIENLDKLKRRIAIGGVVLTVTLLSQLTMRQIKIWDNAESFWRYIAAAFPYPTSDPLVHYNLGNAYSQHGKLDQSIVEYRKALTLKPLYAEAHNNLGGAYAVQGKLDEALSEMSQALAIRPDYAKAHNNLGTVYLKKGELDKAISHYKQSLALESDYGKAHNNLAYAYYLKGKYKLALEHSDKAVNLGTHGNPALAEFLDGFR